MLQLENEDLKARVQALEDATTGGHWLINWGLRACQSSFVFSVFCVLVDSFFHVLQLFTI